MAAMEARLVDDGGGVAEVRIPLPDIARDVAPEDVTMAVSEQSIKVEVKAGGRKLTLLDCDDLWGEIRPTETQWCMDRDANPPEVRVYLTKVDENERWRALARAEKRAAAAGAYGQIEKVKRLFETARDGSADDFDACYEDLVASDDDPSHDNDFPVAEIRDGSGKTALHFSAQLGNVAMCAHLLAQYAVPVDCCDAEGETPLSLAAASHQTETVAKLLEAGASPHLMASSTTYPIHRAALSGDAAAMRLLLDAGAAVDCASDLGTPLHCAAGSGHLDCIRLLLERGGNMELAGASLSLPLPSPSPSALLPSPSPDHLLTCRAIPAVAWACRRIRRHPARCGSGLRLA